MQSFTKAALCTAAAGAMAFTSAAPAEAQRYRDRDNDGISAGEVIAGALIIGGIVTNGGVASTVRDAHLRDIHTVLLSDGCAAFKQDVHEATLTSLGSVTQVMTCAEATAAVGGAQ